MKKTALKVITLGWPLFPYEFKSTKKYWHGQPLPTLLAMPGFLRISVRQSTLQPLRLIEGFFASAGFAEVTAADS